MKSVIFNNEICLKQNINKVGFNFGDNVKIMDDIIETEGLVT